VLAAAAAAAVIAANSGANAPAPSASATFDQKPADAVAVGAVVPAPAKLAGSKTADTVTFTWENPEPASGDVYMWRSLSVLEAGDYKAATKAEAVVAAQPGAQTCIEVVIRRSSGQASPEPAKACVP
jgi:hypothetical protein